VLNSGPPKQIHNKDLHLGSYKRSALDENGSALDKNEKKIVKQSVTKNPKVNQVEEHESEEFG